MKNKTHICVVGTGIGGGSLIEALAMSGLFRITIVEAGNTKRSSNELVNHEMVGRPFGVRTTRAIQVGGTSNLWHGVLAPLAPDDFEAKDYVAYSGWPISYKDIEPYYKRAAKTLGLGSFDYYNVARLPHIIEKHLTDISFNREYLESKIFQQPTPPKNFKNAMLDLDRTSKDITLLQEHVALKLVHSSGRVSKLLVGIPDGNTKYIEADVFVLAAGALETPRILLNSNIDNDNIGKYLMDHPMGNLCQINFKKPKRAPLYSDMKLSKLQKIKSGLVLKKNIREKFQLLNHCFYLRPSFVKGIDNESEKIKLSLLAFRDGKITLPDIWNFCKNFNVIRQILTYKLSLNVKFKYADLFFVTEQRPNPNSRVTLSNLSDKWGYPIARVDWQVMQEDIDEIRTWNEFLRTKLLPQSEYDFTHKLSDFNWEETYTSAIHHIGTARMSESKSEGVVDKNLKVHGLNNLYICDGSVFCTSGNVNSSFTISALATRLADYFRGKLL